MTTNSDGGAEPADHQEGPVDPRSMNKGDLLTWLRCNYGTHSGMNGRRLTMRTTREEMLMYVEDVL